MKKLLFLNILLIASAYQMTANDGMNLQDAEAVLRSNNGLSTKENSLGFLSLIKACSDDINTRSHFNSKKMCLSIAQTLELTIQNMDSLVASSDKRENDARINRIAESYAQIMKQYSKYIE